VLPELTITTRLNCYTTSIKSFTIYFPTYGGPIGRAEALLSNLCFFHQALPLFLLLSFCLLFQLDHLLAGASRKRSIGIETVDSTNPGMDYTWTFRKRSGYVYPPLIEWPWRRDGGQVLLRISWDGTVYLTVIALPYQVLCIHMH
ncbi:hypothetical protein Tco_0496827, partial [Tanacetum coccineum]